MNDYNVNKLTNMVYCDLRIPNKGSICKEQKDEVNDVIETGEKKKESSECVPIIEILVSFMSKDTQSKDKGVVVKPFKNLQCHCLQ